MTALWRIRENRAWRYTRAGAGRRAVVAAGGRAQAGHRPGRRGRTFPRARIRHAGGARLLGTETPAAGARLARAGPRCRSARRPSPGSATKAPSVFPAARRRLPRRRRSTPSPPWSACFSPPCWRRHAKRRRGHEARRGSCAAAALTLLGLGLFAIYAHFGYEIADPELGRFRSFHDLGGLREASADRAARWAEDAAGWARSLGPQRPLHGRSGPPPTYRNDAVAAGNYGGNATN